MTAPRRRDLQRRAARSPGGPRRAHHHVAQPQAHPAHPGAGDLRGPPVDHVRAAVRRRLRRRDHPARLRGRPEAYREFLMPGIFAQNIVFAAGITAIGITDDVGKGIIDRFRSLPMARSAVLTGRSFADVVYNLGILIVLMLSGLFVGWTRPHRPGRAAGRGRAAAPVRLRDVLAGHLAGPQRPDRGGGHQVIFTVLFPITFLSNAFVPPRRCRLAPADRRVEPDVAP